MLLICLMEKVQKAGIIIESWLLLINYIDIVYYVLFLSFLYESIRMCACLPENLFANIDPIHWSVRLSSRKGGNRGEGVVILASYKFNFIREHDNLV